MENIKFSDKLNEALQDENKRKELRSIKSSVERMSIEESKQSRSFKSYSDMIITLKRFIQTEHFKRTLAANQLIATDKPIVANSSYISSAILSKCDVAVIRMQNNFKRLYIQNPETKLMTASYDFFKQILTDISSHKYDVANIEIHDIKRMTELVVEKLTNDSSVRDFVKVPNKLIISNNNLVYNTVTRDLVLLEEIENQYDITNKNKADIIVKQLLSEDEQALIQFYRKIISRVMQDWSEHRKDVEQLMWEVIFSVLRNENLEKYIVIKGPGGNGKSTYMSLLAKLAGEEHTMYLNIHQFGDPNAINQLDMNTKVAIGDDAATNHKISDTALSNMKSVLSTMPISVPMKYSQNVTLQTNAVFVQGTNTDLNFFENNPAVKDRLVVIPWTTTNFRDNKPADITFDLADLMNNHLFISTWLTMCIELVEPFDKYTIPQVVKDYTNEMIASSDALSHFLEDKMPEIEGYDVIPARPLYQAYINWSKVNNPSSGVKKYQTFVKELADKAEEFGFEIEKERRRFSKYDYMNSLCEILDVESSTFKDKQSYLRMKNPITRSDLDAVKNAVHPITNPTDRQRQILKILMFDQQQTYLQSVYQGL